MLVMEFIEGVSLAESVKQSSLLPVAESCDLIRQAAVGLEYVHSPGLLHRDIKPHNLLVSRTGQVKILDLGMATLKEGPKPADGELTCERQFLGTPDFAAPEQWESSRDVDILGLIDYRWRRHRKATATTDLAGILRQLAARFHVLAAAPTSP
jgi:serine/threonine protein kinase